MWFGLAINEFSLGIGHVHSIYILPNTARFLEDNFAKFFFGMRHK